MKSKQISTLFSFAILFFLTLSSCKKETTTQTTTVNYNLPIGTISDYFWSGTVSSSYTITDADLRQAFATVGVTYDVSKVNSAKLTSLQAVGKNGYDFSDVSKIDVYIKIANSGGNGVLIATASNNSSVSTLNLQPVSGVDLKPYIINPLSELTVVVTGNSNAYIMFDIKNGNVQSVISK